MVVYLGVDTGGTYTDAVLIEDELRVLASAKALTTRGNLAEGIVQAISAVLREAALDPARIALACLSTTLATNALVEGQGGRAALILIGFRPKELGAQGLEDALQGDPVHFCSGGHDHAGEALAPLDEAALRAFCAETSEQVSAFAVAGQFATRNPAHERRAAQIIAEETGQPVSASHQLSAKLNGPKRALTALLNARLIGMIDSLIGDAERKLSDLGIVAPLMVVRGDGALISAAEARRRPIETILSGPAASLVGARWLTGAENALVSDIGGTTTDIALLRDGRPDIDPEGARVGPFRTMVEAVAMRTTGLGGDSEVHLQPAGLAMTVVLGPSRCVPISLLATEVPGLVHDTLDAQLRSAVPSDSHARFLRAVPGCLQAGFSVGGADLLDRLGTEVQPFDKIVRTRLDGIAMRNLIQRGALQVGAVTPSDACHVLGLADFWDGAAAKKALQLLARRRTPAGTAVAETVEDMARQMLTALTDQTTLALLEAALTEENFSTLETPAELARHEFLHLGLRGHTGLLRIDAGLNLPVIGLGASAGTYYPEVGARLKTQMTVPAHAEVANAIGAVVGQIRMSASGTISAPSDGLFRVHHAAADAVPDFHTYTAALAHLEAALRAQAEQDARRSGAVDLRFSVSREEDVVQMEGREVIVEARIRIEAAGRPRLG